MSYYDYGWRPYVTVAMRRRGAAATVAKLERSGRVISPVVIEDRTIARTFWGAAWCRNLEAYSDYANRLPRGRTYARNGSVIDLQIERGRVQALVSGSSLYEVEIDIKPLPRKRWTAIKSRCAGQIGSMVELLQGTISRGVMEIVTRKGEGLFPAPRDISLRCSCPDWATMCKHVAAVLYGVGARLDHGPEMLFTLRGVEPTELIAAAVTDAPTTRQNERRRLLKTDDMSSVFGIELDAGIGSHGDTARRRARRAKKPPTRKATRTGGAALCQKPAARAKATTTSASTKAMKKKTPGARSTRAAATRAQAKPSGAVTVNETTTAGLTADPAKSDVQAILATLREEKRELTDRIERISKAIGALTGGGPESGSPREVTRKQPASKPARKKMSAAARRAIALRMRKYWAERRKADQP